MAMIAILARIECFADNISAIVESPQNVYLYLGENTHNNAFEREFCEQLQASTRILTLLTDVCEYESTNPGLELIFSNATCSRVPQLFFTLEVEYPEHNFSQTLEVPRVMFEHGTLPNCYEYAGIRYDSSSVELHYKFDCELMIDGVVHIDICDTDGTTLLSSELPDLASEEGVLTFTGQDALVTRLRGVEASLLELRVSFDMLFVQNEVRADTGQIVPQRLIRPHIFTQTMYNRTWDGDNCLDYVRFTWFENRILLQQSVSRNACTAARINTITVEYPDDNATYRYEVSDYDFAKPEFYINNTELQEPRTSQIVIGFLQHENEHYTFSYRTPAVMATHTFDGLRLVLRRNQLCVSAAQETVAQTQVRRYTLYLEDRAFQKDYSLTDFYPLDEYCFYESDRRVMLSCEKNHDLVIFKVDNTDVYIIEEIDLQLNYESKYEDFIIILVCGVGFFVAVLVVSKHYTGF